MSAELSEVLSTLRLYLCNIISRYQCLFAFLPFTAQMPGSDPWDVPGCFARLHMMYTDTPESFLYETVLRGTLYGPLMTPKRECPKDILVCFMHITHCPSSMYLQSKDAVLVYPMMGRLQWKGRGSPEYNIEISVDLDLLCAIVHYYTRMRLPGSRRWRPPVSSQESSGDMRFIDPDEDLYTTAQKCSTLFHHLPDMHMFYLQRVYIERMMQTNLRVILGLDKLARTVRGATFYSWQLIMVNWRFMLQIDEKMSDMQRRAASNVVHALVHLDPNMCYGLVVGTCDLHSMVHQAYRLTSRVPPWNLEVVDAAHRTKFAMQDSSEWQLIQNAKVLARLWYLLDHMDLLQKIRTEARSLCGGRLFSLHAPQTPLSLPPPPSGTPTLLPPSLLPPPLPLVMPIMKMDWSV